MKKIIYLGLAATFASSAMATTYEVDLDGYPVSNGVLNINKHAPVAGYVDRFYSKYNNTSEQLSVSMTLSNTLPSGVINNRPEYNPQGLGDGFWVVLTEGLGPQTTASARQYTILIGDKESKAVNSYVYRPTEDKSPLTEINLLDQQQDSFIQSFANAFQIDTSVSGKVTYSFDIDATDINNYNGSFAGDEWKGVKYGKTVGIWAHPFFLADVALNDDGSYSSLNILSEGWFDTPLNPTASDPLVGTVVVTPDPVPVPAAVWFFVTGLLGFAGLRQRKS
jgi:hypothetical protein